MDIWWNINRDINLFEFVFFGYVFQDEHIVLLFSINSYNVAHINSNILGDAFLK